jgi:hypothetical protein
MDELKAAIPAAPSSLRPLLDCYLKSLSFYAEFEQRKKEFLSTSNLETLRKPILGLDPTKICPGAIETAAKASSAEDRQRIVDYDWGNPLNTKFQESLCDSTARWDDFLKRAKINAVQSDCQE